MNRNRAGGRRWVSERRFKTGHKQKEANTQGKKNPVGKLRQPQKKEKRKTGKHTPVKICSFQLNFLSLCQFVVTEGHCSVLVFLPLSFSTSPLLFLLCLSYKLSVCCLVEGAESFSSLSPILAVSLRKYAMKRADYWMALKLWFCLLISPSSSLSRFHSCFFFGLSHTHPSLFII